MPLFLVELGDTIIVARRTTVIVRAADAETASEEALVLTNGPFDGLDTGLAFEEDQVDSTPWTATPFEGKTPWEGRFWELLQLHRMGMLPDKTELFDYMRELNIHQNELRRFMKDNPQPPDFDEDVLDDDNFDGNDDHIDALKARVQELRAKLMAKNETA